MTLLEPPSGWPADVALSSAKVTASGDEIFVSTSGPWSRARRGDGVVWLLWPDITFEIRIDRVIIDAADPLHALDLYWNSVLAATHELRETSTLHGFAAVSPKGDGIAVIGASGAGKTTTGLELLEQECRLLCDDLIILGEDGVQLGRPFVRQVASADVEEVDSGGKVRLNVRLADRATRLSRVLMLDPNHVGPPQIVSPLVAMDLMLKAPHLPIEATPGSQTRRVIDLSSLLRDGLTVVAAAPRSTSPSEMAGLLLNDRP